VAYKIQASKAGEVQEYLDIREINGYTIHYTPFWPADGSAATIRTMVYIGTPENPQFLGPQDPQVLAERIHRSVGPAGPNKEYLWALEMALEELDPSSGDEHVTNLADRLRKLEAAIHAKLRDAGEALQHERDKAGSRNEQEETAK